MNDPVDRFLREAPGTVDSTRILGQWRALSPRYPVDGWLLPLPPWARRPFDHDGAAAWSRIREDLAGSDCVTPFCLYVHIPFCSSKCGFCDSYSFRLATHSESHSRSYVDTLCRELDLWAETGALSRRPVSTVHLGGGTPTFLPPRELERLATHIRSRFATAPTTEWALESTVEALSPEMMRVLHDLGFRRLHVGVQSLEDPVRTVIGRRRPASAVLLAIESARRRDWVVSVDLVCGLPGESIRGFLDALPTLQQAGVDGFSIYELLVYHQNRRWCDAHGLRVRNRLGNFLLFLAAADLLENRGFERNLFNHWANARDANVYFTFPARDEDLLAVGAIADGVFGDYHYRHPRYAEYLRRSDPGTPGLEGGLRRNASENRLRPWNTAVLSTRIPGTLVRGESPPSDRIANLVRRWVDSGLVHPGADGSIRLSASGSWFAGNLLADVGRELTGEPGTGA